MRMNNHKQIRIFEFGIISDFIEKYGILIILYLFYNTEKYISETVYDIKGNALQVHIYRMVNYIIPLELI